MPMDRVLEKRRWSPGRIAGLGGGFLFAGGLLYLIAASPSGATIRVDPERISVSRVVEGEFRDYIPVLGIVEPIQTVYISAIEGGQVAEVLLEDGAPVDKGTLILRLNNTDLQKESISTESRLFENLNQLRNTRINLEEKELLLKQELLDTEYRILQLEKQLARLREIESSQTRVISEQELETVADELEYRRERKQIIEARIVQERTLRVQQLAQVDDTIDRVERNLDIIAQTLDNLEIRAPISGQLSTGRIEIGQNIRKGDNIGQIDILDALKVRAEVDQYYVARVAMGQQGSFDFDRANHLLEISKIYPEIENDRFEVDMIFVDDPPRGLRRGQSLRINLSLGSSTTGLLVDRGGFYNSTGGQWIYQVTADGTAAFRREIRIGRQNPQYFELLGGLDPGARVITSSYDMFGEANQIEFERPLSAL